MTPINTEFKVQSIVRDLNKEEFIYQFLSAYGVSTTSIDRLKKGDYNLSKTKSELAFKDNIFFKVGKTSLLLDTFNQIRTDSKIISYKPKFIILTDYNMLFALDVKQNKTLAIPFIDLPKNSSFFLPLIALKSSKISKSPTFEKHVRNKLVDLYQLLIKNNIELNESEDSKNEFSTFFFRLLFCFYSEDSEVFEESKLFTNTLRSHTADNGADMDQFLSKLFNRLNGEDDDKFPSYFEEFPYVNNALFKGNIRIPIFNRKSRQILIDLGSLQWEKLNPEILIAILEDFSNIVNGEKVEHEASIYNILKLIKPLFLDELYSDFHDANDVISLQSLLRRMANMKFFDPANGSGIILTTVYREVRKLELEALKRISSLSDKTKPVLTKINLNQFYGIESNHFLCQIATLSLWLTEHQTNINFKPELQISVQTKPTLPIKEEATIICGNAAKLNWEEVCPMSEKDEVYIISNLSGKILKEKTGSQESDMEFVFKGLGKHKKIDYSTIWLLKSKNYIYKQNAKGAFAITSSICNGEQVALIWPKILSEQIEIGFAHKPLKWSNGTKGSVGPLVVILGIRNKSKSNKFIYEGDKIIKATNINPYLIDYKNVVIERRFMPLSLIPEIRKGSLAIDNGFLRLDEEEKNNLIKNSLVAPFIKQYSGVKEFLDGTKHYCIWITEENKDSALNISLLADRVKQVEQFRKNSTKPATRSLAATPYSFGVIQHQQGKSIIVPATNPETREYMPIGYLNDSTVISNAALVVYNAEPWLFALLSSKMHMVWASHVGGKTESQIRYSSHLVYNTLPFPEHLPDIYKEDLKQKVINIIQIRAKHLDKTISTIYDFNKMPKDLRAAHHELDITIDKCYRRESFSDNNERLRFLLRQYEIALFSESI